MNTLQLNKLSLLKILFIVWLPSPQLLLSFCVTGTVPCPHISTHTKVMSAVTYGIMPNYFPRNKAMKKKKKTKIDKNTGLFTIFISIWKNINTTEYWWTCNHNMQSERQWWQLKGTQNAHTNLFIYIINNQFYNSVCLFNSRHFT